MSSGRVSSAVIVGATALLLLSACASPKLSGEIVSKDVTLQAVKTVRINGGSLRIRQGSPTSLTVRTDRAVQRYVVARQKDGVLELGVPDDSDVRAYVLPAMPKNSPLEFELTTDSLGTIDLGDGTVTVDGFKARSLLLNANLGRAAISHIDVDEWRCEMVGGVAEVTVSGIARTSSHTNSSGSHYDDRGLRSR
jgi:hypothetical protein